MVNFVPRWLIIITMLLMYLQLYFFLRKHSRFAFGHSSNDGNNRGSRSGDAAHHSTSGHASRAAAGSSGGDMSRTQYNGRKIKRVRPINHIMPPGARKC